MIISRIAKSTRLMIRVGIIPSSSRSLSDKSDFIKYAWNIKGEGYHFKAPSADLDILSSLVDVPEGNRSLNFVGNLMVARRALHLRTCFRGL